MPQYLAANTAVPGPVCMLLGIPFAHFVRYHPEKLEK